jgi:hypothetical protein
MPDGSSWCMTNQRQGASKQVVFAENRGCAVSAKKLDLTRCAERGMDTCGTVGLANGSVTYTTCPTKITCAFIWVCAHTVYTRIRAVGIITKGPKPPCSARTICICDASSSILARTRTDWWTDLRPVQEHICSISTTNKIGVDSIRSLGIDGVGLKLVKRNCRVRRSADAVEVLSKSSG